MTGNIWLVFALLSALFAALTSIFAKVGIECDRLSFDSCRHSAYGFIVSGDTSTPTI